MQVGNELYLFHDYRISCRSSEWMGYAVLGYGGVLVYVCGIPLFFFVLLYRARNKGVQQLWAELKLCPMRRRRWLHAARVEALLRGRAGALATTPVRGCYVG
jgi:hypothetical protein